MEIKREKCWISSFISQSIKNFEKILRWSSGLKIKFEFWKINATGRNPPYLTGVEILKSLVFIFLLKNTVDNVRIKSIIYYSHMFCRIKYHWYKPTYEPTYEPTIWWFLLDKSIFWMNCAYLNEVWIIFNTSGELILLVAICWLCKRSVTHVALLTFI